MKGQACFFLFHYCPKPLTMLSPALYRCLLIPALCPWRNASTWLSVHSVEITLLPVNHQVISCSNSKLHSLKQKIIIGSVNSCQKNPELKRIITLSSWMACAKLPVLRNRPLDTHGGPRHHTSTLLNRPVFQSLCMGGSDIHSMCMSSPPPPQHRR